MADSGANLKGTWDDGDITEDHSSHGVIDTEKKLYQCHKEGG